jgi:myxalamid-type polyketide synthase MxaB
LDTLAFYQRSHNINGISINWGPWAQIGLAANLDKATTEQMHLNGLKNITPKMGMAALEQILITSSYQSEIVLMDIDWESYFYNFDLSSQKIFMEFAGNTGKKAKRTKYEDSELIRAFRNATAEDRHEILSNYLETEIRKILDLSASIAIDRMAALSALGMDSLMAVEFRNRINQTFRGVLKHGLSTASVFEYKTINDLALKISEESDLPVSKPADSIMNMNESQNNTTIDDVVQDSNIDLATKVRKALGLD